jgi:2-polyprenyl-3-methyl-5-hydroxy-6-metoxy-1,4-benzoquinol methylase
MDGWTGVNLKSCPACSSTRFEPAGRRKDGATVSRCSECGIGFLNPMPTDAEIQGFYHDYFARKDGIGYENYSRRLGTDYLDYLIWDTISSLRNPRGCSVLDVGCAFGSRVAFLRKGGMKATGVDVSTEAVEHGKKNWNLDLHVGKFEDFEFEGKFDFITMIDFIEHVPVPDLWARKMKKISNEGCVLLIHTPDFDYYSRVGERWVGYSKSYEHVLYYNRQSIRSLLSTNGFSVLAEMSLNLAGETMDRLEIGNESKSDILTRTTTGLRKLGLRQNRIDQIRGFAGDVLRGIRWRKILTTSSPYDSLFVIARKNPLTENNLKANRNIL